MIPIFIFSIILFIFHFDLVMSLQSHSPIYRSFFITICTKIHSNTTTKIVPVFQPHPLHPSPTLCGHDDNVIHNYTKQMQVQQPKPYSATDYSLYFIVCFCKQSVAIKSLLYDKCSIQSLQQFFFNFFFAFFYYYLSLVRI